MKGIFLFVFIFYSSFFRPVSADSLKKFFKKSGIFFSEFVKEGKVNYSAIVENTESQQELQQLNRLIEHIDLSSFSKEEKMAFLIDTYNILVISQIVEKYPIASPFKIDGFFDTRKFTVAGEVVSLNRLQKEMLEAFQDLRIPFALCTGTKGSFPLNSFAYKPGKLQKQLSAQVQKVVNCAYFIRKMRNSSRILLCESFLPWSKTMDKKQLIDQLNAWRAEALPTTYSVAYFPTDHSLNAL